MGIKNIEEPDIYLTRGEEERLRGQYLSETRNWYGINPPPSFEVWVRARKSEPIRSIVPTENPEMIVRGILGAWRERK
jgi:hypothetical protein